MKTLLVIILSILLLSACKDPEKLNVGFAEPDNPEVVETALWNNVEPGLQISFGSVDERYNRDLPPDINYTNSWEGVGWRGEKIHSQFLLWANADVKDIHWEASELKDKEGNILSSESVEIRAVRYVLTDEFLTGCGYRDSDTIQAHLVGDMLEPVNSLNLPADARQFVLLPSLARKKYGVLLDMQPALVKESEESGYNILKNPLIAIIIHSKLPCL